jgi:hypothetical protein
MLPIPSIIVRIANRYGVVASYRKGELTALCPASLHILAVADRSGMHGWVSAIRRAAKLMRAR